MIEKKCLQIRQFQIKCNDIVWIKCWFIFWKYVRKQNKVRKQFTGIKRRKEEEKKSKKQNNKNNHAITNITNEKQKEEISRNNFKKHKEKKIFSNESISLNCSWETKRNWSRRRNWTLTISMRQMERFFFFFSQLWITIFYHCQGLCVLGVFLGGLYGVSWIIFYFVDGNYPNKENEEPSGFFSTNDKCFISFLSENFSKKKKIFFSFRCLSFFFTIRLQIWIQDIIDDKKKKKRKIFTWTTTITEKFVQSINLKSFHRIYFKELVISGWQPKQKSK